jgi:hypothetical protein
MLAATHQRSDNELYIDPQPADVVSSTGVLTYAVSFDAGVGFDLSASSSGTDMGGMTSRVNALTPGATWMIPLGLAQPLQSRAALQVTTSSGAGLRQRELLPSLQLGYAVAQGHTLGLDVRRRSFRPDGSVGRFDETTAVLQYTRPF